MEEVAGGRCYGMTDAMMLRGRYGVSQTTIK